jgi:UDP-glucose 4-epimerase
VSGEFFNVGSGGTYSVNRLAELIGGPKVNIPKRPGEPDCTWADVGKIHRYLAWQPTVSFEKGVATMMAHIEDWRSSPLWTPEKIDVATHTWFQYLAR